MVILKLKTRNAGFQFWYKSNNIYREVFSRLYRHEHMTHILLSGKVGLRLIELRTQRAENNASKHFVRRAMYSDSLSP